MLGCLMISGQRRDGQRCERKCPNQRNGQQLSHRQALLRFVLFPATVVKLTSKPSHFHNQVSIHLL
jgi:hypothetical protein